MASVDEESSDEEIFFGKMTLKEVKKHIWMNPGYGDKSHKTRQKTDRNSLKIIEAHSQPNLRSNSIDTFSSPGATHDHRTSDGSFIQMENLVSNLSLSPENGAELELNNTLDIVNYILNNGPVQVPKPENATVETEDSKNANSLAVETENTENTYTATVKTDNEKTITPTTETAKVQTEKIDLEKVTTTTSKKDPLPTEVPSMKKFEPSAKHTPKVKSKTPAKASPKYFTPVKSPRKQAEVFSTPSSNMMEAKTSVFKTPANPQSLKKPSSSSLKNFTPSRSPRYQHIRSPIATYINGSGEVRMVTNVCPKKPLPGGSLIPKLVKKDSQTKQNKENVNLPTTAYKSAKKTRVVHVPDKEKTNSHVAKKLLPTLPQSSLVLKHETREFNSARKPLIHLQEDTMEDLSCLQADLSVCTPVKKPK